ncbi:winged helix-turn-helix transcriptional regulator [Fusibacillus kribbianus]
MSFVKEEKQLRYEYLKTELGYSLKPVLDAMWAWGEEYQAKNR